MNYFDIHNHILPGVDDGAQDLEEALSMIEVAYGEGTRSLVLTPHYERNRNSYTKEELQDIFQSFKNEVQTKYPDMNLYLGNEILWDNGIIDDLKAGKIQTMNNTKYVLVEFNIRIGYKEIYEAMRQLINARFRPIIAHVERYRCLFKHPERLDELINMDVTLQMNISSVYGGMLDENARWCKKLVREGYISFFGTDAHDLDNRAPYVKDYVGWIKKKCGEDLLEDLFMNHPQKMIENKYLR
ncbi:MAG: CpsB/CapC family capsule biosynthesis tyrosine phosphatase [Lachnospiraceae bacterium]